MSHHNDDPTCPLCEEKLSQVHQYLRDWFHIKKTSYPDMHVAWGYRNKDEQEQAYSDGATKLHYPMSAHNKTDESGQPWSWAIDVFQIQEEGIATFNPIFYAKLNQENVLAKAQIFWGGNWSSLGDRDHFQYSPSVTVTAPTKPAA